MPSIRFTGILNTEDMEAEDIDLTDPSGLSAKGYDAYTSMDSSVNISTLEDLEVTLEP
jgi:hypothetical protein